MIVNYINMLQLYMQAQRYIKYNLTKVCDTGHYKLEFRPKFVPAMSGNL